MVSEMVLKVRVWIDSDKCSKKRGKSQFSKRFLRAIRRIEEGIVSEIDLQTFISIVIVAGWCGFLSWIFNLEVLRKVVPLFSVMAVAGLIFFCSFSQPAWKKPMIVSEKQSVQKCIHHCSSFHRLANELESNHRNEVPQATIGCSSILSWLVLPSKLPSLWRKERENQQAWVRPLHYHIFSVKAK